MIFEDQLWAEGAPDRVIDGEVLNCHGRPVHLRALIQRRWGWPKKAAYAAADFLREESDRSGRPAMLWLDNPHRDEQQNRIINSLGPGVLADLFSGLARGGSRERHDAAQPIQSITIQFDNPVEDSGMIKGVLGAIANRMGCNMEELREASHFSTRTSDVKILVSAGRFHPDG